MELSTYLNSAICELCTRDDQDFFECAFDSRKHGQLYCLQCNKVACLPCHSPLSCHNSVNTIDPYAHAFIRWGTRQPCTSCFKAGAVYHFTYGIHMFLCDDCMRNKEKHQYQTNPSLLTQTLVPLTHPSQRFTCDCCWSIQDAVWSMHLKGYPSKSYAKFCNLCCRKLYEKVERWLWHRQLTVEDS